ncbi:MAG: type VI secretion system tip protein VgrG [Bacteroidota bacterium]
MINLKDKIVGIACGMAEVFVQSEDEAVPRKYELLSAKVSREVNRIASARLTYIDETCKEKLSDKEYFKPGNKIQISAGSVLSKELLFEGFVVRKSLKVKEGTSPTLVIECKDEAVKLTTGENSKYYYNSTDSSIIEEIIGSYPGLKAAIEPTTVFHEEMVQYHATDWDFLLARTEANCQLIQTENGTLISRMPSMTTTEDTPTITNGRNVFDFHTKMDARTQYETYAAASWSPAEQKWIIEEGEIDGMDEQGNVKPKELKEVTKSTKVIKHTGDLGEAELKALADAADLKSKLARLIGHVKIDLSPLIKPGGVVKLEKFGERFDGSIFVTAVQHEIARGAGYTHVQFGLPEEWEGGAASSRASGTTGGLLPSVQGLQIGIVTALEEDPKLHYRVKIRLPIVDDTGEGQWARMAMTDAGEKRGLFFYPEIGDEVVVGFLDEDPRHPVILGMLHSKAKPAHITPANDNHEKGLMTKSGIKLLFKDDKKQIEISTPAENSILLDEESKSLVIKDQNNNTITMDSKGITIESGADLVLKAKNNISLEGANITHTASAKFKAEGTAGAELLTNAINTIKGSLVQIN